MEEAGSRKLFAPVTWLSDLTFAGCSNVLNKKPGRLLWLQEIHMFTDLISSVAHYGRRASKQIKFI